MEKLRSSREPWQPRHRFGAWLASFALIAAASSFPLSAEADVSVGVGVSVGLPPPPLPVYVQPPIPAPGFIWVPGYWAWDGGGYYWVPGTWVEPPYVGALWTPGYWGWSSGVYVFHGGYWGPHVGFYGGINYGFGYTGVGYAGGYWRGGAFYYNRSVNHIENVHITHVYNRTVVNNVTVNRTSFNGGRGGIAARPTPQEASFARERHTAPVSAQEQQRSMASQNQAMHASFNHGSPSMAATPRAGQFNAPAVEGARGGANGRPEPAAMNAQRTNTAVQAPHDNMALHSANFAPHGGSTPGNGHEGSYSPSNSHASYTRGAANPVGGYHVTTRPQPNYAAHMARPAAAPAYHPNAPMPHAAAAPHAQPHPQAAPHREGGEHR